MSQSTYEQFRETLLNATSEEHRKEILIKLKYCPNCNDEIGYDEEADMYFCGSCSHPMSGIDIDKLVRNYTRDLTLEDVLMALRVNFTKEFDEKNDDRFIDVFFIEKAKRVFKLWNLTKPANLQSEETLLEIINLLK